MMSMSHVDPMKPPPPILTSEPGSFARRTFETRVPKIILDIIAANEFPPDIVTALHALRAEVLTGVIAPLRDAGPDRPFWDEHARPYLGRSWLDVPWYWAEAFLYRRVLEATRYFEPGDWFLRDPYARQKQAELKPEAGPHALHAILERLPRSTEDQFRTFLYASLWGNRADLSHNVAQNVPGSLALESERVNLIVDDAGRVWELLDRRRGQRVNFVVDNAGTELLFDLAFADFLLRAGLAGRITFHLKPQPFFVSDAMVQDAQEALAALANSAAPALVQLAKRLHKIQGAGDLSFVEHPFWSTSLFYFDMPDDLRRALDGSLVVFKGDANYRRLLGDAHWDPATPFAAATAYLPVPLVALRTLKSELIVGLERGRAEQYAREDSAWLTNGKRGVAQCNWTSGGFLISG